MCCYKIICTTIRKKFIQDIKISNIQYWAEYWAAERTIYHKNFSIRSTTLAAWNENRNTLVKISWKFWKLYISIPSTFSESLNFQKKRQIWKERIFQLYNNCIKCFWRKHENKCTQNSVFITDFLKAIPNKNDLANPSPITKKFRGTFT